MKILALDVATKTGWKNGIAGGVWNFTPKRDESGGLRLMRFRSKLQEVIELERPDVVVFEKSAGRHVNAVITQAELHGTLKVFLEDEGIEYKSYSATEIKKFATGKGNCGKPAMIQACKDKLGITPIDDNHADAIWIYELAKSDFKFA